MPKKKSSPKIYKTLFLTIIFLAFFLRFYRFSDRWLVDFDPARDLIVAREAIKLHKIPQIGAFSSAGPFVWGPLYYWFIMLAYLVAPSVIFAPAILYALMDIVNIFVMYKVGKLSWSKKGALITAFIASISPALLFRANFVNQPTLVIVCGSLVILNLLLYAKTKKLRFLLFMGLAIGWALNNHFQALNYLAFGLIIIFVEKTKFKRIFYGSILFLLGILIPLLPLVYWDFHQGWKNISNVLDYFLIGQYRIWVSNRWLTYAGQFWPKLWSTVVGGHIVFGYLFMILNAISLVYQLVFKKITKSALVITIVFAILVVLNRYYRGERFEGYMVYFYPLILYFSSFTLVNLFKFNKWLFTIFVSLVFIFTAKANYQLIKEQMSPTKVKPIITSLVNELKNKYPEKKFQVFDYRYHSRTASITTSFFLSFANLIDEKQGDILGFSVNDYSDYLKIASVSGINQKTYVYNLTSVWNAEDFNKDNWINVSPKYVCLDILEWWKVKEFKSVFCLPCFVKEKLHLN